VPEYYCSFDAKLPGVGKVIEFWKPFVTTELNRLAERHLVWNLLPSGLAKVWQPRSETATVVTVEFHRKKRGGTEPVTDGLESLIGGFVNMLVRGSADSIESLEDLKHPDGFVVDFERSGVDSESRRGTVVLIRR
jgi:cytoplasmic iron level regulating protein YaaA (DUF328/UPF0246 family)